MINNKKVLAVIPARGGSKELPNKNILPIQGKPLIQWTVKSAQLSKYIDQCVVSTDNIKIAEIAKKSGAIVPFIRPKNISLDSSKGIDVVKHAINFYKGKYDVVIYLQPTSPLRTTTDIDKSLELLTENKSPTLVSFYKSNKPLHWHYTIDKNLQIEKAVDDKLPNKNRQDYEDIYLPNGAIYAADIDYLNKSDSFYTNDTIAYIMPKKRSIDIDDEIDFLFAESILNT